MVEQGHLDHHANRPYGSGRTHHLRRLVSTQGRTLHHLPRIITQWRLRSDLYHPGEVQKEVGRIQGKLMTRHPAV